MPIVEVETTNAPDGNELRALLHELVIAAATHLHVRVTDTRARIVPVPPAEAWIGEAGDGEPWVVAHVHVRNGKTNAQKHAAATAITALLAARLDVPHAIVRVLFASYERADWVTGAVAASSANGMPEIHSGTDS